VVRLVGEAKAASEIGVSERADCCDRVDQRKVAACTEKFESLCMVGVGSTSDSVYVSAYDHSSIA